MNREELKAIGLSDEQIEKVMASHGKIVNATKDKLEAVTTERNDLKTQLDDRDKQLEELGKRAKDNEELTAEIERLKDENKKATKELQDKLDQQAFDFALEKTLAAQKARNPKAVKALLNTEAIKLDGDKLLGLEEQLTALKESDGYLFGEDQPAGLKGRDPHPPNPDNPVPQKNPFSKEHFNLTEQGKLFRENPDLYKQLKAQAGK
jgi:chromosome segregation ATPase